MTLLGMSITVLGLLRLAKSVHSEAGGVLTGVNVPVHVAGPHDTTLLQ